MLLSRQIPALVLVLVLAAGCQNPFGTVSDGDSEAILTITCPTGDCDFGAFTMTTSNPFTITYQNTSTRTITLDGAARLPGNFRQTGGTCVDDFALAASAQCTLLIAFEPTASTTYSGSLEQDYHYLDDKTATRTLTGRGLTPASLALSGTTAFGTRVIGEPALEQIYTLTNSGQSPARLTAESGLSAPLTYTGGSWPGTGGTCPAINGVLLGNGTSCTIRITFTPTVSAVINRTLTVTYFDGATAGQTTQQSYSGTGITAGVLTLSDSDPFDYGVRYTGTTTDHTFTVTHSSGEADVTVTSLSGLATHYLLPSPWPGGGTCSAFNFVLSTGQSCTFVIRYSPTLPGTHLQTMAINYRRWTGDAGVSATRQVTGEGVRGGWLDIFFDTDGKITANSGADELVKVMVTQSDGKILLAGSRDNGVDDDFVVARLTAAGALDTTFDTDGIAIVDFGGDEVANGMALQADGSIILVGTTSASGAGDVAVARLDSAGALDTTYDTDGMVTININFGTDQVDVASAVKIDSGGNAVLVGSTTDGSDKMMLIARLDTVGALDGTFNATGFLVHDAVVGEDDEATALGFMSDNRILVAGTANNGTDTDFAIARLDTVGVVEISTVQDFGGGLNEFATAIHIYTADSDKFLVAGGNNNDVAIAKFTDVGTLDTAFDTDGLKTISGGAIDTAHAIAIDSASRIVLVGQTSADFLVIRMSSVGVLDTTFDVDGVSTFSFTGGTDIGRGVTFNAVDEKLLVGGGAGNVDFALARLWD